MLKSIALKLLGYVSKVKPEGVVIVGGYGDVHIAVGELDGFAAVNYASGASAAAALRSLADKLDTPALPVAP